jgi:hypothetical protein
MNQDEWNNDAEALHLEATSEEISPAIRADTSVKMEEIREHQLEMIDIAQANTNSAFEFARELVSARTPSQLMDLCTVHAQKQLAEAPDEIAMSGFEQETSRPKAHIEARPKGQELDPITDFVVEDDTGHVLGAFDTQMEAILWAKEAGHEALVTRARDLNDKNNPDHWRSF